MGMSENIQSIENRKAHLKKCPFGRLLDSLPAEDRVALEKALTDRILSIDEILRVIHKEGLKSSNVSILAHRKGTCTCEPSRQTEHGQSECRGA
jgi:hypothetical protein